MTEDLSLENLTLDSKKESEEKMGTPNGQTKEYVVGKPAFCLKITYNIDGTDKLIYINVCHHEIIPPPSDETIPDPTTCFAKRWIQFSLPSFISGIEDSQNEDGVECSVTDFWLNSTFFKRTKENEWLMYCLVKHVIGAVGLKLNVDLLEKGHMAYYHRKKFSNIMPLLVPEKPKVYKPTKLYSKKCFERYTNTGLPVGTSCFNQAVASEALLLDALFEVTPETGTKNLTKPTSKKKPGMGGEGKGRVI